MQLTRGRATAAPLLMRRGAFGDAQRVWVGEARRLAGALPPYDEAVVRCAMQARALSACTATHSPGD